MFVRLKRVRANGRHYEYLHIVENSREGGRVRQRIVGSLGRLDELLASGELERVIAQLVERCPNVRLLRAEQAGTLAIQPGSDLRGSKRAAKRRRLVGRCQTWVRDMDRVPDRDRSRRRQSTCAPRGGTRRSRP